MLNIIIKPKTLQFIFAFSVAILITGFLRLQLFSGLPNSDDGFYTFSSQLFWESLFALKDLESRLFLGTLDLYPFMTSWVFGLEVNQYILLRLIDGLVAITASIIFFKVILKESGSTLFTVILATTLFILMNDGGIIAYGFKNSIWAAYLPLFTALLIWQNITKQDNFSFYLIGGLISLGVLLREPFLPFFILASISIFMGYGSRALVKYLIGSATIGFSVLGFVMMLRGWDLSHIINEYINASIFFEATEPLRKSHFNTFALLSIKNNWIILVTASLSLIYLLKLYFADRKVINMSRLSFWFAVALVPLLEPMLKLPFEYHFANCLPGLAGLTAMGYKHLNNQESKKIKTSVIIIISLLSLIVILPTINKTIIKSSQIYSPSDAFNWVKAVNVFRMKGNIERSQYLIAARKIYELSREDSTLAVSGYMTGLYPLTGLLPPVYELSDVGKLFLFLGNDEDKLIKIIKKHRPTIILTTHLSTFYVNSSEKALPGIIEKTNLYSKVGIMPLNLQINYGWKAGTIYRLKDF
jgi:hypothetical protein